MSQTPRRTPGKTPPVVFVFMIGFLLLIIILALAFSGGGNTSLPGGRDTPKIVNDRVVVAMQNDEPQTLFNEIAPSLQTMFPLDSLQKAQQASASTLGKTLKVEVLQPPILLAGPEWKNQWAEVLVRITREKGAQDYLVRYYLENGEWYLFGTIQK